LDRVRDLPKEKAFKNKNTDKIVMEKFERELSQVEQELQEVMSSEEGRHHSEEAKMFNYETMCRLLSLMGFLGERETVE
jgi:hypothetical protein